MVKRSYVCNLCQTSAQNEDVDRLIVGFEWKGAASGDRAVEKPPRSVENHICLRCLQAMAQLAADVLEAGRKI